jgi:hypothetical protein
MKKSFNFDYDISALSQYAKETGFDVLMREIFAGNTLQYVKIYPDVKGTIKVPVMDTELVLTDASCGWNSTGDTQVSQITLETCKKQSKMELCYEDLRETFLSESLGRGNWQSSVPFEEMILADISQKFAKAIEISLWNENKGEGGCFDGYKAQLTASNGAITGSTTGWTSDNALDLMASYIELIPTDVSHRNDLVAFMSYSNYRTLLNSARKSSQLNLFSFDSGEAANGSDWKFVFPASNVLCLPTLGITGNEVYIGPASYMLAGVSTIDQTATDLKAFYDEGQDVVKIGAKATFGAAVFSIGDFVAIY